MYFTISDPQRRIQLYNFKILRKVHTLWTLMTITNLRFTAIAFYGPRFIISILGRKLTFYDRVSNITFHVRCVKCCVYSLTSESKTPHVSPPRNSHVHALLPSFFQVVRPAYCYSRFARAANHCRRD